MNNQWDILKDSLSEIAVFSNPNNKPVSIEKYSSSLDCIGIGTDAAVFRSNLVPRFAFKVFAEDKLHKLHEEERVYSMLGNSPRFASCFGTHHNVLVLSYEDSDTLYDCIVKGTHISEQVIIDVDQARNHAIEKGLNPRDIHLKNIIMQNGRAKLIDVSEYTKPGNDFRWEHLKKAYEEYYSIIDGKKVPVWLVDLLRESYNQRSSNQTYEDFMKSILKFKALLK